METADVVICGGAVTGSAVADALAASGLAGRIVVVEADPSYTRAATALAASGIRQQFSTPLNIRMSAYGLDVIRGFAETHGVDLAFREAGYLTLAGTQAGADALRASHAVQRGEGASVELLDPSSLAERFPHLQTADLTLGAFGTAGEGWFDNIGLLQGLRARARANGAEYRHARISSLTIVRDRVAAVTLDDGATVACGHFVNAAGGQGREIAAIAGIAIPVERRKRTVFAFAAAEPPEGPLPLTIDPTGVWFRPEGRGFIAGGTPDPDPAVAADDFEPRHEEWEALVWPALAARSPAFEALKLTGFWAGHYDMNTLDQNAILGPHPAIGNFLFANGFSGHGLQHAPAIGRGLAEVILHSGYRSLDLSPLGFARIAADAPYRERAVI